MKIIIARALKPLSRKYIGRSRAAQKKLRYKGRFVKKGTKIKQDMFKIIKSNFKY